MKVADLFEDRSPNKKYVEKKDKKTDMLERVQVALEGSEAATATKLAARYARLQKTQKLTKEVLAGLNEKIKSMGDDLFSANDALATRVIETAKFTLTLSASEKGESKPQIKIVDYEKAYGELLKLIPELENAAKKILEEATSFESARDTPTKLTVKSKINEGLMSSLRRSFRSLLGWIKSWGASYDLKLRNLKKSYVV